MSGMVRRLASLLIAVLLVGAMAPAWAGADGDPASDVLLGENVYYPYSPPVPKAVQDNLNAATAAAKKAGLPIKVALIATAVDLGVIPELFGKPQSYAEFLDKEISFNGPQPLLVVMPAGYGLQGVNAKAAAAVKSLAPPEAKTSTALARAALVAVGKIALIVAALLVAGALIVLRRRQGTATPAS
jgi:hypothetical protein